MKQKAFKTCLGAGVILVIAYFFLRAIITDWASFQKSLSSINVLILCLSFIPTLINMYLAAFIWSKLVHMTGSHISSGQSFKILSLSQLMRYIPGRIWNLASAVKLSLNAGIPGVGASFSMVLFQLFMIYSAAIFSLFFLFIGTKVEFSLYPVILFALLLSVCMHPSVVRWCFTRCLRLTGKEIGNMSISMKHTLQILLYCAMYWLIAGFSLYLLIYACEDIPLRWTGYMTGVAASSWTLAYVSFITPGGIGLREGIMAYLLGLELSISISMLVPLIFRLRLMLCEVLCAFISIFIKHL